MSWTQVETYHGHDLAETIAKHLFRRDDTVNSEVLAHHKIGKTLYFAVKSDVPRLDTFTVSAVVVTLGSRRKHAHGYWYSVQACPEDHPPIAEDCPDNLLNLLTQTSHASAKSWRVKCRSRNAAKRLAKSAKGLVPGDVLTTDQGVWVIMAETDEGRTITGSLEFRSMWEKPTGLSTKPYAVFLHQEQNSLVNIPRENVQVLLRKGVLLPNRLVDRSKHSAIKKVQSKLAASPYSCVL